MAERNCIWIAVADDRGGRLFRVRRGDPGLARMSLEEVDSLPNPLAELDRATREASGGATTLAGLGNRRSELLARYVADLMKWLEVHVKKARIAELDLFAPARLQAFVESMSTPPLTERMRVHRAQLGELAPHELERSDVLREVLEARDRGSRRAS